MMAMISSVALTPPRLNKLYSTRMPSSNRIISITLSPMATRLAQSLMTRELSVQRVGEGQIAQPSQARTRLKLPRLAR